MMNALHQEHIAFTAALFLTKRACLLDKCIRGAGDQFHCLIVSEMELAAVRKAWFIIVFMKFSHGLVFFICFLLTACQPAFPNQLTILDQGRVHHVESSTRVPLTLLTQAGVSVRPFDRVLFNGALLPLDQPLPDAS